MKLFFLVLLLSSVFFYPWWLAAAIMLFGLMYFSPSGSRAWWIILLAIARDLIFELPASESFIFPVTLIVVFAYALNELLLKNLTRLHERGT